MLLREAVSFLQGIPPFRLLDEASLERLVATVSLEYYPKGFAILTQGGPAERLAPGGALRRGQGLDALRRDEEIVIDYRSEGDAIGFLSVFGGDRSRTDVTAVKDTTCQLIPRGPFLALLEEHPDVREYFNRTFLAKYMDKAFTDLRNRSRVFAGGEKLLFTTPSGT